MKVNERLILLLQTEGIKQTDFSKKTGYPRTNLNNFLNGVTKMPKVDLIEAILIFFPHWNIRWILLGEGERFFVGNNASLIDPDALEKEELEIKVARLSEQLENCKAHLKDKEMIISLLTKES